MPHLNPGWSHPSPRGLSRKPEAAIVSLYCSYWPSPLLLKARHMDQEHWTTEGLVRNAESQAPWTQNLYSWPPGDSGAPPSYRSSGPVNTMPVPEEPRCWPLTSSASPSPFPLLVLTFEISLRRNRQFLEGLLWCFLLAPAGSPSLPSCPSLDSLLVQLGHFCTSGLHLTLLAFQRDSTVFECMAYDTCLPWVQIPTSCVILDQ